MRYLLEPKTQYKANLHAHTTVSDGSMSALELKQAYINRGYAVIAFTDHDVFLRHNELTDDKFLALNGYEYAIKENGASHAGKHLKAFHLNIIAKSPDIDAQICFNPELITEEAKRFIPFVKYHGDYYTPIHSPDGVNDVIKRAKDAGFIVNYNHPVWSMHTPSDLEGIKGLTCIETVNTNAVKILGITDQTDLIYEGFLRRGCNIFPIACDDNHNEYGMEPSLTDSFGAYTMIAADSLDYTSIMSAIENGSMYATEGPRIISIAYDNGRIIAETARTLRVTFRTIGRRSKTVYDENGVTKASFEVMPEDVYVRLVLTDCSGRHAYSRAYYIKDFMQ